MFPSPSSKSSPLAKRTGERTGTTPMTRTQVHVKSQAGLKWAAWKEDPGVARQEQSGLVRGHTLFQWLSVREDSKRCIQFQMYKRMFSILLRVIISSQPGYPATFLPFIKYLLPGKHPFPKIIYLQCISSSKKNSPKLKMENNCFISKKLNKSKWYYLLASLFPCIKISTGWFP